MTVADPVIAEALAGVGAHLAVLEAAGYAHLGDEDHLEVLESLERLGRAVPGIGHEVVRQMDERGTAATLRQSSLAGLLASRLHVRFKTANRMVAESAALGPRTLLSGVVLAPVYELVAAAQRAELINADHVAVILEFFGLLPAAVPADKRDEAERILVELAKHARPDEVAAAARRILTLLNPDGSLDDERERAAKTGFWMGTQDPDGFTRGKFCFDAPLRALFEAFLAKFAKPGMCNPADDVPVVEPPADPGPADAEDDAGPNSGAAPVGARVRSRRRCPRCGGDTDEDGNAARDSQASRDAGPARRGSRDQRCDGPGHGQRHGRSDHGERGESVGDTVPAGGGEPPPESGPRPASADRPKPMPGPAGTSSVWPRAQQPASDTGDEPEPDEIEPDEPTECAARPVPEFGPEPGQSATELKQTRPPGSEPDRPSAPASGRSSACSRVASEGAREPDSGDDELALAAAAARDLRPHWLRNLDAVRFGMSRLLADPALGRHRGMPVTAVITMTLRDLEVATGKVLRPRAEKAVGGGGTLIAMRDAVRMLAQSQPYLAVFDEVDGRPLFLGRGRRLASTDQRLVLHARDRGCTFPSCPRPGSYAQVHHLDEWSAKGGRTDVDRLGFGCDGHHGLVGSGTDAWATSVCPPGTRFAGRILWHPPASIDPLRRGLLNHFHHPDEYLQDIPLFPGPDGKTPDAPPD